MNCFPFPQRAAWCFLRRRHHHPPQPRSRRRHRHHRRQPHPQRLLPPPPTKAALPAKRAVKPAAPGERNRPRPRSATPALKKVRVFENTERVLAKAEELRNTLKDKVDLEVVFQEFRHRYAVATYTASLKGEAKMQDTQSDKLDKILTHRVLGLPIFLFVMWLMFNLVNEIGAYPQGWIEDGVAALGEWAKTVIPAGQLQSLVVDGIIGGVGAVLSFVPLIVLLFLGISFLEDTGYMARAAFVMDRVMRACGLHGKSFIPLLLGFGCSIPAIMGARILDNRRDRMITILVSQLMSCSARLPVYTLFIGLKWYSTGKHKGSDILLVTACWMVLVQHHLLLLG